MRVGFFATLMDRIQHAYGWDDDQVLNLTVRRAVQISESILQREEIDRWERNRVLEWQTRNLAVASVIGAMMDDKDKTKIIEQFQSLSLDGSGNDTSKNKNQKTKPKKTYKTKDGKEITASELKDYSYDEIDHSEEDRAREESARSRNAGASLSSLMGSFTK